MTMSIDAFGNSPAMTHDEMIEEGLIDEHDNLTAKGQRLLDADSDAPTITVDVPGTMLAKYRDGAVIGWVFMPSASYAGYFGPAATITDTTDEDSDDEHALDVESTDGLFWKAVQSHLAESATFSVKWEE